MRGRPARPPACRQASAYLLDVCRAEAALAAPLFPGPEPAPPQHHLVEALCHVLLDTLRPRYIQLQGVDDLADLVDVLRSALAADAHTPGAGSARQLMQPAFERLTADVQARLMFRAAVRRPGSACSTQEGTFAVQSIVTLDCVHVRQLQHDRRAERLEPDPERWTW
jgi:hypothetical protein